MNMPVASIRAKVREEFEKHRYVNNLKAVDVLISQSHMEFQVRLSSFDCCVADAPIEGRLHYYRATGWLTYFAAGDIKFLEANTTRYEVFPQGRGPNGQITEELHVRVFGGEDVPPQGSINGWRAVD